MNYPKSIAHQIPINKNHPPRFDGMWCNKPLNDIAAITMGQSPPSMFYNLRGEGLPLIQGKADIEDRRTIDRVWSTRVSKRCEIGDLLLTVRAPVGSAAVASKNACLGRGVCGLKPFGSSRFLFHALVHAEDHWQVLEQGSTFTAANSEQVRQFQLHIPEDETEQRAIAEVLSDVEGLIGALDALISKKRGIKQATMQQLLTGKTRLPGFSGEWVTTRLGELGPFAKGRGIKRDDVSDEGLPCIRYGELYTRYQDYILQVVSRILPDVAATALPIKTGDLLFAGSGETAEEIGRCAAYLGKEKAYAGGDIIVLTPSGQDSIYLGHLMNHPIVSEQKARLGQGHAVVHISTHNLAQVQIKLPSIAEQKAIASVLTDIDFEIATLEKRRNKTRAIKLGMMQQLLTGTVRLVKLE